MCFFYCGRLSAGKKVFQLFHTIDDRVIGKAGQKQFAIPFGPQAAVEDGENTAVCTRTDQASEPLLQAQYCGRNLVVRERVPAGGLNLANSSLNERV